MHNFVALQQYEDPQQQIAFGRFKLRWLSIGNPLQRTFRDVKRL